MFVVNIFIFSTIWLAFLSLLCFTGFDCFFVVAALYFYILLIIRAIY